VLVLIKITYCRDGQLIWLGDHFEKAAFSRQTDRIICRYWVHFARLDSSRQRMPGHRKNTEVIQRRASAEG